MPEFKREVQAYIDGVQSGEIVAGKLVRQCVARHVRDLEEAHARGWKFDEAAAERACLFFPMVLRHSIGEWAGQPFMLSPWQAFCTWVLYGWKSIQTGLRRYRKAYLSVARKNGKTTWAAGLALKSLYADEPDEHTQAEQGGQVYCVATKEDQAKLLYAEAVRMLRQSPWLMEISKVRKAPNVVEYHEANAVFKPLGSDSDGTDGLNPHAIFKDELHAWREKHRQLNEKLDTGGASRRQPLEVVITTAGDSESLLWIEEDTYARNVLEYANRGQVFDDRYFAHVATVDEQDDPLDEACWPKANPNLDVSVKRDYLRDQATTARNAATKHNQFVRYHANARTEANERAISEEAWKLGGQPLTIQDGDDCHGGIDLGRTNDWCAIALCFPRYADTPELRGATRWELLTHCWTCTEGRFDVQREPFASWIREGLLSVCRGNAVTHQDVEDYAVALANRYNVLSWAYDQSFARDFAQRLQDVHGMPIFSFSQSHRFYNEPTRRMIEVDLPAGRIIHGNDPVLSWQAANLQVERNSRDEWMPDKGRSRNKIDAMVASIMAFSECLFAEKSGLSYYETNKVEMA
jgi:phage terminase large subunit-like protein